MRRLSKKDSNHAKLMLACERIGATVFDTHHVGGDFVDFVAGFRKQNFLFEVKKNEKSSMRKDQQKQRDFHTAWNGSIHVVWTAKQAQNILLGKDRDATD